MKLIHLSDLHLGKRVNEFSMLEDQRDILSKILDIIDREEPDAVILAGDIYDKPVPPAEAVQLFDDFLYNLTRRDLQIFVISGNHDSPERIAFGSRLLDRSGVHAEAFPEAADHVVLSAALPDTEGARRADASLAGVKAEHDFAEGNRVKSALVRRF